ncbi:Peptidylprolyl isomerase [Alteripontixanthobacter maritimus]|uniref:Peptidyl-prolyl cis-trans isomerase n=1 Tax=Alteripontixanthobacter maritimus TaxID=2161824 RepID=A0A369Q442_9SPHN|nr:FKBP-type peptidyl-prolyl cis-trans isomerase [Alteripontixanthobacter maritimus]RDC59272.1 Peptidylprolyl isomerase [Alteripontixanthobacter maritimus]
MTEITRVPLQPIAKGSLTKLWLGVAAVLLLAAGLAWAAAPKGLTVDTLVEGTGDFAQPGDVVFVEYVGKLADGEEFDRSRPLPIPPGLLPEGTPFPLEEGATIPGFYEGLQKVRKGGKYVLNIPSEMAYGAEPPEGAPIPPNADLTFEVEVNEIMSQADFEQKVMAIQQAMAQQGPPPGADGGPNAPANPQPVPQSPPQGQ